MTAAQWRLVCGGNVFDGFPAPEQLDPTVVGLRNAWTDGAPGAVGTVTIQVDRGRGWETHEFIDFAEETAA